MKKATSRNVSGVCLLALLLGLPENSFSLTGCTSIDRNGRCLAPIFLAGNDSETNALAEDQAKKFKIITCMSTACSKKRESLGLDSLSTFGAMYTRASGSNVRVEEGPCVGYCKKGPCVAVEHDDYFGTVALEGMTADEFSSDAFLNIVTEEDADRVWACVENAVQIMSEREENDDDDDY